MVLRGNDLGSVMGGVTNTKALGRCGPEDRWSWLGNVYTPQCMAHDLAVREAIDRGEPRWQAHLEALPKLLPAIGSYVENRLEALGGSKHATA